MQFIKRFFGMILLAVLFILLFILCEYFGRSTKNFYMDTPGQTASGSIDFSKTSVEKLVENYVNNEIERDIIITATGDQKFYEWQLERAYDEKTGTFDFSSSYQYITKYFKNSYYVIGDIETTLAGEGKGKDTTYNGYGADKENYWFNTPEVLAKNLKDAGFNMITTANEHALDSGVDGLKATIDNLTDAGLEVVGTRKTASEDQYMIRSISGLKVGIIACTDVMNNKDESFPDYEGDSDGYYDDDGYDDGYYDDDGYDDDGYGDDGYDEDGDGYADVSETSESDSSAAKADTAYNLVNYVNIYDDEKVQTLCDQVSELKSQTEAVIIMLHFGDQYTSSPSDEDTALCQKLVDAGADVIFGTHTHVPGSIQVMKSTNTDGTERNAVVIYSMGNFLTSQQYIDTSYIYRDMGYIASVIFKKSKDGVRVGGLNIVPVYSNWTDDNIATIPIMEAYEDPDSFGDIFDDDAKRRIESGYKDIFNQIVGNCGYAYDYEDQMFKISFEN